MSSIEQTFQRLLDPSAEAFDLALFEQLVGLLSSPNPHHIMAAQEVLSKFKAMPSSMFRSDYIVGNSQNTHARFIGLQIMEEGVLKRWNTLGDQERENVKSFILSQIVRGCQTWEGVRQNRMLLTKMNAVLVAIAKRDWPQRWPSFIHDICTSANPQNPMLENNLNILSLLAEDIFEFGEKGMTSRWAERKKQALQQDFDVIYQLLAGTLVSSQDVLLLSTALKCFAKYVPWMALERVCDGEFLQYLSEVCMHNDRLRLDALRCLTEIAALPLSSGPGGDDQKRNMVRAFRTATQNIMNRLPTQHSTLDLRIARLLEIDEVATDVICQWLITFLKTYLKHIVHDDVLLKASHEMLVGLTHSEHKDIFKSCVEYWWWLGDVLLRGISTPSAANTVPLMSDVSAEAATALLASAARMQSSPLISQLRSKLHGILSNVRYALIKNMARPEEVIIVEEEGELKRVVMSDVENLQLYQLMRESLVFLTHLDPSNTATIMTMLMARQLDQSEWSWRNCSTLSWAVGSISGSMGQEQEKDLFVAIMSDLLRLCKEMSGKENKAVIASNIMYVVGQYPRFLRSHASFLRTVCRKLFEFMREMFPGVQDMAVDTFLKLAKQCPRVFLEAGTEPQPFVLTVLDTWDTNLSLLSPAHIECMYEAIGYVVASSQRRDGASNEVALEECKGLILRMLQKPIWHFNEAATVMTDVSAAQNPSLLTSLLHLLRIFSSSAKSLGNVFIYAMEVILLPMQQFYSMFSSLLSDAIATNGPQALNYGAPRLAKLIKREVLHVLQLFITDTQHETFVAQSCMPQILSVVLTDYVNQHPLAREAQALALVTSCVNKLQGLIEGDTAAILDHTFSSTISLLLENMADYPEHRVNLFKLLHSLNEHCFPAFLQYLSTHEDIVNSILWAIKHTERNVMITGLELLNSLLVKVVASPLGESFYKGFMQQILTEVLVSAMDTLHTSGFQQQAQILQQLFQISKTVPQDMPIVGAAAVYQFLCEALKEVPTLVPEQSARFVEVCYQLCDGNALVFRQHIADFLVETQMWGAQQENEFLVAVERQQRIAEVAGLAAPSERPVYEAFTQTP